MSSDQRALAVRTGNLPEPTPLQTRAVWISAGTALTQEQSRALGMVGEHYRLDPALGEIMILDNRVYITLAGYTTIAQRNPLCEGIETWPLSDDERTAGKIAADEHAWGCRVFRRGWRVPAVDWGVASERAILPAVKKLTARDLAKARAVRRACKLAFGVDLPDPDQGVVVDTATGEILVQAPMAGTELAEPKAREVKPDWARFWAQIKSWGLTRDDVHEALRLPSVTQYDGSLAEALDVCRAWQIQKADAARRSARADSLTAFEPNDEEWEALAATAEGDHESVTSDTPPTLDEPVPSMANWGELFNRCAADFRLSKGAVLRELGYNQQPDAAVDFSAAYAQIRETQRGRLL